MSDILPRESIQLAGYYENFLESLARIVSKLLTDEETETFLSSIRSFQEKLGRLSSHNLVRLNMEITKAEEEKKSVCQHKGKTCTQNATRGFIKTFTVGFVVKYLINILPLLVTGKLLKKPSLLRQMAGRDTASFALFLSTFTSGYKAILCTMRYIRKTKNKKSDKLNSFVAGSLAGLSLAIDRDKRRRQSIMLYLLTRALQFSGAWLMKQWAIKRKKDHPNKLKWDDYLAHFMQRYSGVAVMAIASAQIVYAFLFNADTLPSSYFGFLLVHSNFKTNVGKMAGTLARAVGVAVHGLVDNKSTIKIPQGTTSRDFITQHMNPTIGGLIPQGLRHEYVMCSYQHPLHTSCTADKLQLFGDEFLRSMKLYLPLNVVMLLTLRLKQLKKEYVGDIFMSLFLSLICFIISPKTTLKKFTISCLRSALFLTLYCSIGLSTPCVLRRLLGVDTPWIYALTGAVSGSMVFVEAAGRQLELGLYCLPRALESLWKTALKNGYAKSVPHGDIYLFMASMGVLMTLYQNEKDTINSHYLSIMTRFFGTN
ncbi:hypothetical protein BDB01DRAFT_779981 [Pilobolus umbonatus]|nr:hypothetical protein BDB01DRAFT_779981 [Pilobolus umbonatus]